MFICCMCNMYTVRIYGICSVFCAVLCLPVFYNYLRLLELFVYQNVYLNWLHHRASMQFIVIFFLIPFPRDNWLVNRCLLVCVCVCVQFAHFIFPMILSLSLLSFEIPFIVTCTKRTKVNVQERYGSNYEHRGH